MKQVYQTGHTSINSFGTQQFSVVEDDAVCHYTFEEGEHVNVKKFIEERRAELNRLPIGVTHE